MIKGLSFGIQESPCPYLEGRIFRSETLYIKELDEEDMDSLLSIGFRHFGDTFFRPVCDECGGCIPLRVPVSEFKCTRNRKRALRKVESLEDRLTVELVDPSADLEKYELYVNHGERFDVEGVDSYEGFVESFFRTVPFGKVLEVRRGRRLVAASHIDITSRSLSAIYCYWDPGERDLGLGKYAILKEIELAGSYGIPYVYLGYYVKDNPHMSYKADYRPNEALVQEGRWLPYRDEKGNIVSPEVDAEGFLPVLRIK
ncbi:MAG: arginyltransferase [Spirochaetia bacterium]